MSLSERAAKYRAQARSIGNAHRDIDLTDPRITRAERLDILFAKVLASFARTLKEAANRQSHNEGK